MNKKRVFGAVLILAAAILAGGGIYIGCSLSALPDIFRLNEQRKAEGYYLAEFEFKMLGCVYYLDRGDYFQACECLGRIHEELGTTEGLVKIPEFQSKDDELEFYLNLQNPRTGAFMDDSYPVFTYIGPTANVIEHIEDLCKDTGHPFQLKYPLRFLDEIDTPAELEAFLDDLSTQGLLGSHFRSPYVAISELNEYAQIMDRTGLYNLTPEWRQALLQWFYDRQDPQTGFWGPRCRYTGRLLDGGDLVSTEKVVKMFRDSKGRDLYPDTMPLRFQPQMIASILERITEPMPEERELQHDWTLMVNRGTRIMLRYLWPDTAPEDRDRTRHLVEATVADKYRQYYITSEGAFSLYSGAEHADLDGTGEALSYLELVGCFSKEKQKALWGEPGVIETGMVLPAERALIQDDFAWALADSSSAARVNSLRLYAGEPGADYVDNVVCVAYPRPSRVLDRMEMLPALQGWVGATGQSMGNWVGQSSIMEDLSELEIAAVPVYKDGLPLETCNQILNRQGQLTVVGFDLLQAPVYKAIYAREAAGPAENG